MFQATESGSARDKLFKSCLSPGLWHGLTSWLWNVMQTLQTRWARLNCLNEAVCDGFWARIVLPKGRPGGDSPTPSPHFLENSGVNKYTAPLFEAPMKWWSPLHPHPKGVTSLLLTVWRNYYRCCVDECSVPLSMYHPSLNVEVVHDILGINVSASVPQ